MESIIGLYKRDMNYNDLRVGTPDPTQYHDISAVSLELNGTPLANRVGTNHGFSGLRGVIIPRATRDGASRGHNHMIPKMAYIDPELTNRRLIIDPARIRDNPEAMVAAIQQAYTDYPDPADAIIASYAQFSEQLEAPVPNEISIPQPQNIVPTPMASPPTGHPSSTYVAPRSLPGGGQVKPASFAGMPQQPGFGPSNLPPPTPPPSMPVASTQSQAPRQAPNRSLQAIRSLRGEFEGHQPTVQGQASGGSGGQPMRKVTFELPMVGQAGGSMGQFPCLFHDVVKQDGNLILVYDHSCPAQHVWFPPVLEDPTTKEPIALAVLVEGTSREPATIYLAYPTGVRFIYRNEEFCLLTIEKEKPINQQQGE